MKRETSRRHVLITDAGRGSAVAFIRSLGRRGWKVTAADHDPASAGFHSRFTTDKLLYPRPSEHPDAVVDAILARVERDGIDLVVPITDELGLPLAEARDRFAGLTTLGWILCVSLRFPMKASLSVDKHEFSRAQQHFDVASPMGHR